MLHCHNSGYIHHDIKLENILLNINSNGSFNAVKLADFGLSRRTTEKLVVGQDTKGTPQYMAPEMLIKDNKFNLKIDSWSLGIILFEILFGTTLFDADDQKTIFKDIKKFEEIDFSKEPFSQISLEA